MVYKEHYFTPCTQAIVPAQFSGHVHIMLKSGWSRLMGPQCARNERVNYNGSTFHFKIQQVSISFHMAIHHVMVKYIYFFVVYLITFSHSSPYSVH